MKRVLDITLQEQLSEPIIQSLSQDNYLLSGYNAATDTWEAIVLYNGDIRRVAQELQAKVEILDDEYAIMEIAREKVKLLPLYPEVTYVEKPKGLGPALDVSLREACITPVQNVLPYQLKGGGTLVGIIDTGIDYTHPDFISPDGKTRIAAIWDQSIPGNPPAGFEIGTEYTREQIDEALSTGTRLPTQDSTGHGTQVAGIAAGNGRASNGRYVGTAPESELLVVKLKEIGERGFSSTTEIMRAVKYLVEKAVQLQKPIAINLSFGTNEGSHDGNSLFENYINKTVRRGKTTMIVATGNEGDKGRHTSGKLQNRQNTVVEFEVAPQNTAIALEIWKDFVDEFDISITSPSGRTTALVGDTNPFQETVIGNTIVYIQKVPPNPFEKDDHYVIILTPRQRDGLIDGGIWKINFFPRNIVVGDYDIWLPVSEVLAGQTRFLQPVLERSQTIPSTTRYVISVGAYDTLLNNIATFSGRGYPRGEIYAKPEIVAPGVDIRTTNKGGGYTTSSGTSLAAPFVTGSAALMMEWGIVRGNDPFLYGEILKSYLTRGATRRDNVVYPNASWGYGRLCLRTSMDNIIQTRYIHDNRSESEECIPHLYSPCVITREGKKGMNLSEIYASFPYSGQGVLIAVIDSGIDYLHPVFQYQDGHTKIYEIWDQTAEGFPPTHFDYGTIYSFDTINTALQLYKQGKNAYDVISMKDETGHGTALAGLAAGSYVKYDQKEFTGVAPEAQLVIIKVKEAELSLKEKYNLLETRVPVYQADDVAAGIQYAYDVASKLMKPLIVLTSMGSYQGVRSEALYNRLFYKEMSHKKGVIMVTSAARDVEHCKHSQTQLAGTGDVKKIEFMVDAGEKGFNLDIWIQMPDRISLSIISPTAETATIQSSGYAVVEEQFNLQSAILSVQQISLDNDTGEQHFILVFKNPIPGKWVLDIYGELIINGVVDLYLPRHGWVKKGTCFTIYNGLHSMMAPANSKCFITAAAYDYINHTAFPSLKEGIVQGTIQFDLAAPGVNILCPIPGGGFNTGTGCSIAAAITAGSCALLAEWIIDNKKQMDINTMQAKSMLLAMAKREIGKKYPNGEWGYGILDFNKVFRHNQINQYKQHNIKIGYSIANLRVEYWKKTKDLFAQRAAESGIELSILSANNNDIRQIIQAKSLVDAGIDVLIITPHNSEIAAEIVEYAHSKGVPVIAYERLILNSDVDAYVSTDHEKVGQLQAEYMMKIVPSGNYVYIGGPSSDHGAILRRKGVLDVLKPYLDSGEIKLVYNEMTTDWMSFGAQQHMIAALEQNNNQIDVVITGADDLVNGVVAVLATQQLAGKIPIAGINANLDALQRIIEGLQTMTVYRPVKQIVNTALETAIALAKKQNFNINTTVYNGKIEVPSILVQPTTVDKNNIIETVIKDGYQSYEQVYGNSSKEEITDK